MLLRTLIDHAGTPRVTLPKQWLDADDVLDAGGAIPEDTSLQLDRLDERTYLVRVPDANGDVVDLEETETVQNLASRLALEDRRGSRGELPTAD